jgi:hypothetical protein
MGRWMHKLYNLGDVLREELKFSILILYRKQEIYCHVNQWLKTGFGLVIGFIDHLQVVTTISSYIITNLHNLQWLHTNLLSLFPLVFTVRFLATDF